MRPEARLALALLLAGSVAVASAAGKEKARASTLSEAGSSNIMLSQAYLEAGRLDASEERARAAVQTDGNSPLSHATLAMVLAKRNQQDKAQESFQRALALGPNNGAVLNAYGAWRCERRDYAGADDAFRRAIADGTYATPVQPLANAGRCAMLAREWSKADGYLRRAVAIAPRSRQVLLMLAEAQLRLKRPLEARAFVQRSDALGPDPFTLMLGAKVEHEAGNEAAAARYRQRLQEQFPKLAPTGQGAGKP
jgi:type IV pilus assembly protein PilF